MKQALFLSVFMLTTTLLWSQVGINTSSPTADLDVVGSVKTENGLILENPGAFGTIRGSKLLIRSTSNEILEYDISQSKYGPINYAEFAFTTLSKNGLQEYDTKISIDDYILTVQGYYFLEAGTGDTNVMIHSNITDTNIEGTQIYAYKNLVTQTWCLKALLNNAEFVARDDDNDYVPSPIDLFMNVIIYKTGFISKSLTPVAVDMNSLETKTVPLPSGF